jgi:hypothetical protein
MRNTMVKSVFRYLYLLRSYRHLSHYPLESNMAANKMELVNVYNFLMNNDIWKWTSPLCFSSTASPKTCITLPPSHLKCSAWIQYGRLRNGGRQVHPTLWLPSRPNNVTCGWYPSIPYALWFTKGGRGITPHPVEWLDGTFVLDGEWWWVVDGRQWYMWEKRHWLWSYKHTKM